MNFARIFVDRPIFAGVLSIVITLLGALAYFSLPVAQYPEVIPPTVVVSATYPGADARTLAETVSTPLEQEINGVEDMIYLSSSSTSDGRVQITVTFRLGTDLDKAQVLVQNRVNAAVARLPEEVRRLGVIVNKRSPDLTLAAQFYSPDGSREVGYLSNYVTLQIQNEIARLPGVAEASSLGGLDYSMRVWLDPEKVAGVGLAAGDVVRAIREQNVQVAAGSLGQPPAAEGLEFQYTLTAPGRLKKAEEFGDIVLKTGAIGDVVRLRDVARIELGSRDYSSKTYMDGYNAVSLRVFQLPGSNAIKTADAVYARLAQLKVRFPPGIDYRINYDTTKFVRASIKSVLTTLVEAVLLVVFVVILFLQSWRASIIPLLAVPVSLIGTLAVMQAFGFSLNNLSLFGLVLAIGIVVDDAIVVVENVERNIAKGLAPREAAIQAMKEVSGAVIAVALVLCAVFVPTAFVSGITGQFYKQFALTIAVSTVISAFNSLTLSPALCAILLQPHGAKTDWLTKLINFFFGWFFRLFNKIFDFSSSLYAGLVRKLIRLALLVILGYGGLLFLTQKVFNTVPGGYIPAQDMGYAIVLVQLPDASAFDRTDAVVRKMDRMAQQIPGIAHTFAISGYSSVLQANQPNVGAAFLVFDDFAKRTSPEMKGDRLLASIREKFATIQEGRVLVLPPPPLRGLGNAGGFKIQVQDLNNAGLDALEAATQKLLAAAQNAPVVAICAKTEAELADMRAGSEPLLPGQLREVLARRRGEDDEPQVHQQRRDPHDGQGSADGEQREHRQLGRTGEHEERDGQRARNGHAGVHHGDAGDEAPHRDGEREPHHRRDAALVRLARTRGEEMGTQARHRERWSSSSSMAPRASTSVRIRTARRPCHGPSSSLSRNAGRVLPRQTPCAVSTRMGSSFHVNRCGASR